MSDGTEFLRVLEPATFKEVRRVRVAALAVGVGIWELRGTTKVHTFSSVMCWAACDRLARIARRLGFYGRADYWQGHANNLHRLICERAWNPKRNAFVASFDGDTMDASLLLLHELGFVDPMDPRFIGTVEAVAQDL